MESYEYDKAALEHAEKGEQIETMEAWFRAKYEDPARRTPYDGEYIWIWGGPYDAEIALREEFEGIVPEEVIEELAADLAGECLEWAPTERPGDYDEGLSEAVSSNALARQTLDGALGTIKVLLAVNMPPDVQAVHLRLLYGNAITALETYLSDTFINRVCDDTELLQKYLDFDRIFKDRKVSYNELLREAPRVQGEARQQLLAMVWHNLGKVKAMYSAVLDVDLGSIAVIGAAIQTRHDIIHRNGRCKEGGMIEVSAASIQGLLSEISELAYRIEIKLDFGMDDFPTEAF